MNLWHLLCGKYALILREDLRKIQADADICHSLWEQANKKNKQWVLRENIAYQKLTRAEVENARLRRDIEELRKNNEQT